MMNAVQRQYRGSQKGFAFAYILGVLALLAVMTMSLSKLNRGQAQAQSNLINRTKLIEQASLIRSRLIGCAISYPAGDNGTGFHLPYPSTPVSFKVVDLTCPGQAGANNLWSGTGGLTLPAPPSMFLPWTYVNDASNIRISITAANSGNPISLGLLDTAVARLGPSASRTGDTMTIILLM